MARERSEQASLPEGEKCPWNASSSGALTDWTGQQGEGRERLPERRKKPRATILRMKVSLGTKLLCGGIAIVASLGVLAWNDVPIPGIPSDSPAPAKVAYAASGLPEGLSVSILAPPDHLVFDRGVPMELIFTNSTEKQASFSMSWIADCFSFSERQPVEVQVSANDSTFKRILVTPTCPDGFHPISLYVQSPGAEPARRALGSIAPMQLIPAWKHIVFRFFFLIAAFLRVLAIPVALALLAYLLNRKADALKEDQDDRERRGSVLRLLLPEYSARVQKHYLQICRRMDGIESEIPHMLSCIDSPMTEEKRSEEVKKLRAALNPAPEGPMADRSELWKLLSAILLYRSRMLSFLKATGGVYFRSNQAEKLFVDLINAFLAGLNEHLVKDKFRDATGLIDPQDELLDVSRKLRSGEVTEWDSIANIALKKKLFADLHNDLKSWVLENPQGFLACSRLIQLANRILAFECNRPFYQTDLTDPKQSSESHNSGWYFDPPQLEFEPEMYAFPVALQADKLDPEIIEYIDNVPKECKRGKGFPFPRAIAAADLPVPPAL